jgi:hypothetical protein
LKAQADAIAAQQRELEDAKRIAMLEIQLAQQTESEDGKEDQAEAKSAQGQQALQVTVPSNDEAVKALAEVVRQAQETMAAALTQNAQVNAQTQALIVDAIEDMADAMSAPRKIQLQKGADGRTTGATSVAVMPIESTE